jgi:hypothetical protein
MAQLDSATNTTLENPFTEQQIPKAFTPTIDDSVDSLSPPHNKLFKMSLSSNAAQSAPSFPYYGVWNIPPYYSSPSYYSPVMTQPIYPTTFVNNLLDYPIESSTSQLQLSRMCPMTPSLPPEPLQMLSVFPTNDHSEPHLIPSPSPVGVGGSSSSSSSSLQTNETNEVSPAIVPPVQDSKYIDITEYLPLPQSQAAKKLHVPTSTLSKRWKEAVRTRKWPYRAVCKLDKEIMTILYNIPQSGEAQGDDLPPDVKAKLGRLLRERQDLLRPVFIRL